MPVLTIPLEARGAIMTVGIGVSLPRSIALKKAGLVVPQVVIIRALIDTGANCTCVDPEVIKKLALTPSGVVHMLSASTGATPHVCNQFDVAIVIAMDNQVHVPSLVIPVIESNLKTHGFHALIGRDVLDQGVMIYDGPRRSITLTF
jgi:predicted aspartyl protease